MSMGEDMKMAETDRHELEYRRGIDPNMHIPSKEELEEREAHLKESNRADPAICPGEDSEDGGGH